MTWMRIGSLLLTVACLTACRPTPSTTDAKSPAPPPNGQIAVEPKVLCSALKDAGMPTGPWKQGADGFGCVSTELQVGPKGSSNMSSAIWYEVRGTDANSPTTVVLGGDVRVPNSDAAVRSKFAELANQLLKKLNLTIDEDFRAAIQQDRAADRLSGVYAVRYASELAGKVRENRLTIKRLVASSVGSGPAKP